MELNVIIEKMKENENFIVREPKGKPQIKGKHILPEDVVAFYEMCGGIECYVKGEAYPIRILAPEEVVQANPVLVGEECEEDISSSWYLIADAEDGNYISIDFDKERNGRCYESFFDTHALRDNCPVVARSFTEFLKHLLEYKGDYFYWLENDAFEGYGDAYQYLADY